MEKLRNIKIGDKGCSIQEIVEDIRQSLKLYPLQVLPEVLLSAFELNFHGTHPSVLRLLDDKSLEDMLEFVLQEWHTKTSEAATLQKLLSNLKSVGLEEAARNVNNGAKIRCLDLPKTSSLGKSLGSVSISDSEATPGVKLKVIVPSNRQHSEANCLHNKFSYVSRLLCGRKNLRGTISTCRLTQTSKPRSSLLAFLFVVHGLLILLHGMLMVGSTYSPTWMAAYSTHIFQDKNLEPLTGITFTVLATSYEEYQVKMQKVPGEVHVDLHLGNLETTVWPKDAPLVGGQKIRKLSISGNLDVAVLLAILPEVRNLETLIFENTREPHCKSSDGGRKGNSILDYIPSITLNKLRILKFHNTSSCGNLYNVLATEILTKNLNSLEFKQSIVDQHNLLFIYELLNYNSKNLQKLSVSDSCWETLLLNGNMPQLASLLEVTFDGRWSRNALRNFQVVSQMIENFPSVKKIVIKNGYLPLSLLSKVLEFQNLQTFKSGVEVPPNTKVVKMGMLRNGHRGLQNIQLSLKYLDKSQDDECHIEGAKEVQKKVKLMLEANCQIKHL